MRTPETPREFPFLERESVKDFIKFRKILPEDFPLLEELSKLSRSLVIMTAHNFFMGYSGHTLERAQVVAKKDLERAIGEVERRDLDRATDFSDSEEQKILLRGLLHFVEKYDWTAVLNLEEMLEREGQRR